MRPSEVASANSGMQKTWWNCLLPPIADAIKEIAEQLELQREAAQDDGDDEEESDGLSSKSYISTSDDYYDQLTEEDLPMVDLTSSEE